MPLQNRVTPFGNIIVDNQRGVFTGNRGILHDPKTRTLHKSRRWTSKAWIYCVCDSRGRKREVFGANGPNGSPGWTNLFFLDEVTALAAGHRPCFYCQRDRAKAFQEAFSVGQNHETCSAPTMDAVLHAERLDGRNKLLHPSSSGLPSGAMVASEQSAYLLVEGSYFLWSMTGYKKIDDIDCDFELLTPPSTIKALNSGFEPKFHPSIYEYV